MNSTAYLNKELVRIFDKFQNAIIKYEFKSSRKIHLFEITPLEIYESESFIIEEIKLMDDFAVRFPKETILFVSDESITKVTNPSSIYRKSRLELCFKNDDTITEASFNSPNQDFSIMEDYNFSLAA